MFKNPAFVRAEPQNFSAETTEPDQALLIAVKHGGVSIIQWLMFLSGKVGETALIQALSDQGTQPTNTGVTSGPSLSV